ncbi:MAG: NADH-quinone oxidoreductase subunit N [Actinomycetota bacterium]|jgi:NADH-quinone oxidoreductase subunit N|nr:NADH-quinone oxidoreductase subunit N [Acidimicrobiales bacterium]MEC7874297.1 NADH-quinone oxidoreductase subunit N [Actinomycetota bacterium]MCS5681668.1 NADH-quinone oxidoreductase subunit N [Acidimicrobiales bacterium]MEC8827906.1 NADH-quinone oxidoreductase subunit N [Actinomycetota bacterium]MEC9270810.1 NADH-quinone oxidoreductase subunit N [Actinomycetota bacterium]|tara:strand:- start:414 stop:1904 length:1491 start_codon:yes stop_codon:yes gene_type:complete
MDVLLAFTRPSLDWHALAPELTLLAFGTLITIVDIIWDDRSKQTMPTLAGIGLLATLVPILTLAVDGTERSMFGGAYVVDDFSLVLKALFLISGYIVVLMSVDYIREGDYYENEYYTLMLTSLLGMVMMSSSRDLVSVFVALELLSIPAYMLAAWRKGGPRSNEAGLKYYLMGVFASAVMLYGMSLVYGLAGSTTFDVIAQELGSGSSNPIAILGILFVLIGFAFKVSAVPFHTWAPDTYEGAPTPVTAFLAVASKTAGMVALIQLVFVAFLVRDDVIQPFFWLISALTMTVGNLIALRQTNIVRLLAYSGIAQGGFMLVPFAVAADAPARAIEAVVIYLAIYAFMNLGAFTVVLAVARKTRSGEIDSYSGLFQYAPGLAVAMTVFLAALAGIPPAGGWFAKFGLFRALLDAGGGWAAALGVIVAINTVIAFAYYARVLMPMWFQPVTDGDERPIVVTGALGAALTVTLLATMAFGVLPGLVGHFGEVSVLSALGG